MNKTLLILFFVLLSCKGNSQDSKEDKLTYLKTAFLNKNEKKFLENFPKTFVDFNDTFGWDEEKDAPEALYNNANQYIDYWFSLLEKPEYYKYESQIISICKDGIGMADAVNYFKNKSLDYISNNKKYNLINNLPSNEAKSVLRFLFDSSNSKQSNYFIENLNDGKQKIVKAIFSENVSNETKRSSLTTYENNKNYFIKNFDVNKDGFLDKIVSSKPYHGEDLFVFLGDKDKNQKLILETRNFSEDGGNVIQDILPMSNSKGFTIITSFPDRGYYEKEYNLVMQNNTWILKNIIYKTMSDVSEDAVKYICDVSQNIDITKSGWTEKINPIPDENIKDKKCKIEKTISIKKYYINDPDGYSNLREEKSSSSEVLQKIKSGEHIEVIDNSDDWFLVKTKEGKTGYIHKSRVKSN